MFTEMFAMTNARILAVDLSPDLLIKARKRKLPAERVTFLQKRFEDCNTEGPFDAVIGSSVLHHLDLSVALRKIYQLLKPGGALSFAEPNMLNPQVFAERKFRRFFPYVSPDETAFTRWEIGRRLRAAGFSCVRVEPFDWLHPSAPPGTIPMILALGAAVERIPFIREFAGSLFISARR
jgi:2-polyprenyl-3-methyl-5-hydroxy-6-metoxy-1,4-benzoquinol methylase